jgi:WD40 repeat protein
MLYSSGSDGIINIWNIYTGNLISSIYSHNSWARSLFVDEKFIISGGYKPDSTLKIFDKNTGKIIKTFQSEASIFVVFSNKNFIAYGGSDNKVHVIDRQTLKYLFNHSFHERWIRDLLIAGNILISCGDDGKIIFFDLQTLNVIKEEKFNERIIKILSIEEKIYAVSPNGKIYDLSNNEITFQLDKTISSAYSNEKFVYIGDNNGTLYILDNNFHLLNYIKLTNDPIISICSYEKTIFASTSGGKIFRYNISDNSILSFLNNFSLIKKTSFYKDKLYVLKTNGSLISYDITTGEPHLEIINDNITNFYIDETGKIYYSNEKNEIISPDRNIIFNSENDISLIFKFQDYLFVGTYEFLYIIKNNSLFDYIQFENDWPISYFYKDNTVKIGTNSGKVYIYDIYKNAYNTFSISKDPIIKIIENFYVTFKGKIFQNNTLITELKTNIFDGILSNEKLILSSIKGLIVFDTNMRNIIKIETEYPVISLQVSQNIYIGLSNGDILIFDEKFKELGKLAENESKIIAVDLSKDGNYVATGGADKKIKLWKIENGNLILLKTYVGHNDWIRTIKFTDNNYIISGSSDNTIKIWDFNGRLIKTLSYHSGYVWSIEYKDGLLFSGGWDNNLFIYDLNTDKIFFQRKFESSISHLKINNNGLYISLINGKIKKLDLNNLKIEDVFSIDSTIWNFDIFDGILAVGDENGFCYLIDLNQKKLINKFQAHRTTIFNVKLSTEKIITASSDNTIKIFDFNGILKGQIKDFSLSVLAIAIDPIRNFIITSSGKNPIILQIP